MTKKLGELLNLPDLPGSNFRDPDEEPVSQETRDTIEENQGLIEEVNTAIDKIDAALPFVSDLDKSDEDLDELSDLAKDKATDLLDLGMNIDPRFAGPIFQTASVLLGHAVSAKTAKMDKKLRMISLQLQKARLDHQIAKDAKAVKEANEDEEPIDGKGMVLDRNALLAEILKRNKPATE
jgi:hypothetical protein